MSQALGGVLKSRYKLGHQRVLKVIEDLTEEQMRWHPTSSTHSVAWNAWHLGRWADYLQARIPALTARLGEVLGPRRQIWEEERLAVLWGLDPVILGWGETGTDMDDGIAAALPLPNKDDLLGYMRRSYEAAELAVDAIENEEFTVAYREPYDPGTERTVAFTIIGLHAHDERHLGQIAFLRRMMELPRRLR